MAAIVTVLALLVITGAVLFRRVIFPIQSLQEVMTSLSNNDLDVEITVGDRNDEIGQMAGAVTVFKDNAIERERLEVDKKAQRDAQKARAEEIQTLVNDFEKQVAESLDATSSSAAELEETARTMSATAGETSEQSTAAATASRGASVNVQTVAAASEQLSASIHEIFLKWLKPPPRLQARLRKLRGQPSKCGIWRKHNKISAKC